MGHGLHGRLGCNRAYCSLHSQSPVPHSHSAGLTPPPATSPRRPVPSPGSHPPAIRAIERGDEMMDPAAEIPQCQGAGPIAGSPCVEDDKAKDQGADPIPSSPCVDGNRLLCSRPPADPVSNVLSDDNLLIEILVRLPPKPSSLPRASAVCRHWGSILSEPKFRKRFRKHHRKPPLLGFFRGYAKSFIPAMTRLTASLLPASPGQRAAHHTMNMNTWAAATDSLS
ncbi:hypothetical protein VPH35_107735 [Triticum aestivum]|uniref:uncharacterized protein n=1 Tax=Triticum aestivum TaxID=4565 RepID=UPI001D025D71|nr:uncharacterized protein LOC123138586 [Triticum aestivum]